MQPALNGQRAIAAYRQLRWEARLRRQLRATLAAQQAEAIAHLRSRTAASMTWDEERWADALSELDETVYAILAEAAGVSVRSLGAERVAFALSLVEDALRARVSSFGAQVGGMVGRLVPALENELAAGVAAGESVDHLVERVHRLFAGTDARTRTLVRTWVVGSSNQAAYETGEALVASGEQLDRAWLAAQDSRTRPDHAEADGQRVGHGEPFIVGGEELMFPGDPSGSLEQVANCRCSLLVLAPDEE